MILRIMRHEWRSLNADRTLLVIAALFVALISYGVYNGARWAKAQTAMLDEIAGQGEKQLAELRAKMGASPAVGETAASKADDPYAVGGTAQTVVLPLAPLAALSVGQGDLYPHNTNVSLLTNKRSLFQNYEFQNPLNLLAGRFDLAFVTVYLLPLLILALSYNLLSAEKEQGTLAMLLSQPVALKQFVIGKLALRAAVVLGVTFVCALAALLLSGASLTSGETLMRLLLWLTVIAAYGGFWLALALVVNAFGKSSATNAVALAAVWLAVVVVIPSLFNILVTALYPVPPRVELVTAVRDASLDARRDGSRLLAKYYEDHPELRPEKEFDANDFSARFLGVQMNIDEVVEPVAARYDEQLAKQQAAVNRFRFLSPAVVAQEALNDIAGTGQARYRRFRQSVEQFAREWRGYFAPKVFSRARLSADDYDEFPRFRFQEEATTGVAGRVVAGLLGLLLPTLAVGGFGWWRLRRYPVIG